MKRIIIILSLTAALAFALSSCNKAPAEKFAGQKGKAFVEFTFKSSKTEEPKIKPMVAFASDIAYVILRVTPANVTQTVYGTAPADGDIDEPAEMDAVEDGGQLFQTTLTLSVGSQTFTATAYNSSDAAIGVGSATTTIISEQTIMINLIIIDSTGPADPAKHAPLITSVTASKINPIQNESITLTVTAVDPDDDALTYKWTSDCGGTFTADTSASTDWSKDTTGLCVITITVNDATLSASATLNLRVYSNQGDAFVEGRLASNPYIYKISLVTDDVADCVFEEQNPALRGSLNASCSKRFTAGRKYNIEAFARLYSLAEPTWSLTDTCSGVITEVSSTVNTKKWSYSPQRTGLCKLTVGVSQAATGLSDGLMTALVSTGCASSADCSDYCNGVNIVNNGVCGSGNVCEYSGSVSCSTSFTTNFTCVKNPVRCTRPCDGFTPCDSVCYSETSRFTNGSCINNYCSWGMSQNCPGLYGSGWECRNSSPVYGYCVKTCESNADCPSAYCEDGYLISGVFCNTSQHKCTGGFNNCLAWPGYSCPIGQTECKKSCATNADCGQHCLEGDRLRGGTCGSDFYCSYSERVDCYTEYGNHWYCTSTDNDCTKTCNTSADCGDYCYDGATLKTGGSCNDYKCAYGGTTDCSATGQVCQSGACVTP